MAPLLSSVWTQFFPPKSKFTEKDVGDLAGKVRAYYFQQSFTLLPTQEFIPLAQGCNDCLNRND